MLEGGKESSYLKKVLLNLLKEIRIIGVKHYDTPMIPNVKVRLKDGKLLENLKGHRHLVRKLNYLTIIRPNTTFSINVVS